MLKRILVATDGSDSATRALRIAVELARPVHAELIVLNIFEPHEISTKRDGDTREFARVERLGGAYAEATELLSEDVLAAAKAVVNEQGGDLTASFVALDGDATTEILRYADQIGADMTVLGSRGRSRLAGLLLGSVSQKVASLAARPVLIVR